MYLLYSVTIKTACDSFSKLVRDVDSNEVYLCKSCADTNLRYYTLITAIIYILDPSVLLQFVVHYLQFRRFCWSSIFMV